MGIREQLGTLPSRRSGKAAWVAMGALVASLSPLAAQASLSVGNLTKLYSGTAPFDADNAAGNDADATNSVIRSNDRVGYRFFYQTTGADTNTQVVFTAPAGARWSFMPTGCGHGSSIAGLVLTCRLGELPNPQTQSIDFEMNAGARTQGAIVAPPTAVFTSDQTPTHAEQQSERDGPSLGVSRRFARSFFRRTSDHCGRRWVPDLHYRSLDHQQYATCPQFR